MPDFVLRVASPADVEAVASLVNRAFVVERFFKDADRTHPAQVQEMMQDGQFLRLCEGDALVACVYVKIKGERAYLGTLSVDPARQKSGIGSQLMRRAEDYCRARGCNVLDIRVVNLRTELPAIYRKLGFAETGTQPSNIPNATRALHFITMSKAL